MDYQVWIKDEYEQKYAKVDCGDLLAAKRVIDEAVRAGGEPILTVEVPYSLAIQVEPLGTEKSKHRGAKKETETKVEEEPKSEADQGEAEPSESTGD